MDGSRIAILIPAHREAETIGAVVTAAGAYGDVIVIDDASPDDTSARAEAAGAIVLRNAANRGYEGALNRAFEKARELGYEWAVTMDADGEHDPAVLADFCALLVEQGIPLVLGVRPRKQRISEVIMGYYIKTRYGIDDILCGMKGYRMSLVAEHGGFDLSNSIGTELAIDAVRRGNPFRQVPVRGKPRQDAPRFGRRLLANWRIFRAFGDVLRRDLNFRRPQRRKVPPH